MFELNEKYKEAIGLSERNGTITLALFRHGDDGKDYMQWGTREIGKDRKVQKLPVGLKFESEAQLKEFATWLMNEVNPPRTTEAPPF